MTINTTLNTFNANSSFRINPNIEAYQNFQVNTQYTLPQTTNSTFTRIKQPLVTKEINAETINTQNVVSNSLTTDSLNASYVSTNTIAPTQISGINQPIHPWANIPCFYVDNAIANNFQLQEFTKPIYCSYRALGANDDAFLVYPGYILVVYRYASYIIVAGSRPWAGDTDTSAQTRTIDNSTGTSPIFITSTNLYGAANQVQSCKVYYKTLSNEMSLPYYSYSV
jgi:hypothetical protein